MLELKRIMHPSDFSEGSRQALNYACFLASQFNAELHLMSVVHNGGLITPPIAGFMPPGYYEQLTKYAMEQLDALPGDEPAFSGPIVRHVSEGVPHVEIIRYAKEKDIDLVVMGTHGYTGLKYLLIGSVAENVVRKAHCPVLTVHPEDYEFVMP